MSSYRLAETAEIIEGQSSARYGDDEMPILGRTLAEQIAQRKDRPTGVIALNDMMAMGLLFGFQSCGLRVPQDISVIGMDDLMLSGFVSPGITSIRPPFTDMARTMVGRIVSRLGNPSEKTQEKIYSPRLIVRGSVMNLR